MKVELLEIGPRDPDRATAHRARVSRAIESKGEAHDHRTVASCIRRRHLKPLSVVRLWWQIDLPLFVLWHINTHEAMENAHFDNFLRDWRNKIERSQRYCKGDFNFYVPLDFEALERQLNISFDAYEQELANGRAPEDARLLLPAYALYTTIAFDCNLKNFLYGLCTERLTRYAQSETRQLVQRMFAAVETELPEACAAFRAHNDGLIYGEESK